MDELLRALAEAVRAGTAHAMPALVGYYVVRVVEALSVPLGFIAVIAIIGKTIRYSVNRTLESDERLGHVRRGGRSDDL